jgi:hypothetical protein
VLDNLDSMIYPNGGFDDTHLNDGGHSLTAVEVTPAVLERLAKIGRSFAGSLPPAPNFPCAPATGRFPTSSTHM